MFIFELLRSFICGCTVLATAQIVTLCTLVTIVTIFYLQPYFSLVRGSEFCHRSAPPVGPTSQLSSSVTIWSYGIQQYGLEVLLQGTTNLTDFMFLFK
jgi:hypothetical protein